MARRRSAAVEGLNPWPGYVDALSTLLMVIIFVLLVFVLAQAFLSVTLSGRDRALDRLNRQMAELSDMLSLERGHSAELRTSLAEVGRNLQAVTTARDTLSQQLNALRAQQDALLADRNAIKADRDQLAARLADAALQAQAAQARSAQLQTQLAEAAKRNDAAAQQAADTAARLADTQRQLVESAQRNDALSRQSAATSAQLAETQKRLAESTQRNDALSKQSAATSAQLAETQKRLTESGQRNDALAKQAADTAARLADAQQRLADTQRQLADQQALLAEMKRQQEALDKTVQTDKATLEAKLSDLAKMAEQVRNLTALRDELEKQAQDAAVRATTEQQRREAVAAELAQEKTLGDSARAQIAVLNQQLEQLRAQLGVVSKALDASEASGKDKDVQIANLSSRLNTALAQKVEELQRYRSDFFGKLREVLANRPGIQVVGDRFVFQSEVLFPVGSADLTPAGQEEINKLATTLTDIAKEIPPGVNWLLRVDGHADKQPISGGAFASNWELSAERAINVVKLLIADGIPPERLAATGFADYQPLDPADTPEAYAKNRRIEIRLTDR